MITLIHVLFGAAIVLIGLATLRNNSNLNRIGWLHDKLADRVDDLEMIAEPRCLHRYEARHPLPKLFGDLPAPIEKKEYEKVPPESSGPYTYTSSRGVTYVLHSREATLKNGTQRTLYFFAKDERDGACYEMPGGYHVVETKHGLPVLKRA